MTARRPDDARAEIGDLDDDSLPEEPGPARVVIQYRDRGVPWMLVPPLLALAGVIAVVAAYTVHAKLRDRPVALLGPGEPARQIIAGSPGAAQPPPESTPEARSPGTTDAFGMPAPDTVAAVGATASVEPLVLPPTVLDPESEPPPVAVAEPAQPSDPIAASAPAPVPGMGVDPATLNADAGGAVDPDVNSAQGAPAVAADGMPAVGAVEAPLAPQPAGVAADVLPPDPRTARAERLNQDAEARRRIEAERISFHADVRTVYLRFREKAAPQIQAVCRSYDMNVPPAAMEQATKALGKTGMHVGAGTTQRIALLRRLGFPEPMILQAIYDLETAHVSRAARDAPTPEALYLRSAVILLNHPPTRPAGAARPIEPPPNGARVNARRPIAEPVVPPDAPDQ